MEISIFRSNAKTQNSSVIATLPKKLFSLSPNVTHSMFGKPALDKSVAAFKTQVY